MVKRLITLTIIIIVIASIGSLSWSIILHAKHDAVMALTAFAVSATTFFGVISLNRPREGKGKWSISKESLRTAITSCILITYVFLLAFTTFVGSPDEMSGLTEFYTQMFSNIAGVTLAFYFTASAAVEIFAKKGSMDEEDENEETKGNKAKDDLVKKNK